MFGLHFSGHMAGDSIQLSAVLKRKSGIYFQSTINVLFWRHCATGIIRVHLKGGGFKREYWRKESIFDKQAAHGSRMAGTEYACGLNDAPGTIESKQV